MGGIRARPGDLWEGIERLRRAATRGVAQDGLGGCWIGECWEARGELQVQMMGGIRPRPADPVPRARLRGEGGGMWGKCARLCQPRDVAEVDSVWGAGHSEQARARRPV